MSLKSKFPFPVPGGSNGSSGGGSGPGPQASWKLIAGLSAGLALLAAASTSYYTVQPEQRAVVKRFGAVTTQAGIPATTGPGLHFKLPLGIDTVELVPTERILKEEFGFRTTAIAARSQYRTDEYEGESLMLTGDLNMIKVEWVVQFRIQDPIKWLYEIREPEHTLRDVSESVMRQIVGNRLGSEVLTVARVQISQQAKAEIQEIMDSFNSGVSINTVELQDVLPTVRVQPAFNEVNIARQERERMINEAEKRRNQVLPRASGQANQLIASAEGYAAERVNRALGEATRFTAILQEYRQAPEVTRRRLFLEMIDQVLPSAGQVLVVQDGQQSPLPVLDMAKSAAARQGAKEGAK